MDLTFEGIRQIEQEAVETPISRSRATSEAEGKNRQRIEGCFAREDAGENPAADERIVEVEGNLAQRRCHLGIFGLQAHLHLDELPRRGRAEDFPGLLVSRTPRTPVGPGFRHFYFGQFLAGRQFVPASFGNFATIFVVIEYLFVQRIAGARANFYARLGRCLRLPAHPAQAFGSCQIDKIRGHHHLGRMTRAVEENLE